MPGRAMFYVLRTYGSLYVLPFYSDSQCKGGESFKQWNRPADLVHLCSKIKIASALRSPVFVVHIMICVCFLFSGT
jgi:hypothetical protein